MPRDAYRAPLTQSLVVTCINATIDYVCLHYAICCHYFGRERRLLMRSFIFRHSLIFSRHYVLYIFIF